MPAKSTTARGLKPATARAAQSARGSKLRSKPRGKPSELGELREEKDESERVGATPDAPLLAKQAVGELQQPQPQQQYSPDKRKQPQASFRDDVAAASVGTDAAGSSACHSAHSPTGGRSSSSPTVMSMMEKAATPIGWIDAKHSDGLSFNLVSVTNGVFVCSVCGLDLGTY